MLKACDAILEVDFDPRRLEMLFVDNASADDTFEVPRAVADRHKGRVRVIVEDEFGLPAARYAGISAASGEITVYASNGRGFRRSMRQALV